MTAADLIYIIAAALLHQEDDRIRNVTVDGGSKPELMIDSTDEEGNPVTFIIRSADIEEEPTEDD